MHSVERSLYESCQKLFQLHLWDCPHPPPLRHRRQVQALFAWPKFALSIHLLEPFCPFASHSPSEGSGLASSALVTSRSRKRFWSSSVLARRHSQYCRFTIPWARNTHTKCFDKILVWHYFETEQGHLLAFPCCSCAFTRIDTAQASLLQFLWTEARKCPHCHR